MHIIRFQNQYDILIVFNFTSETIGILISHHSFVIQFESLIVILDGEEKKKERLRMKALQELLLTEAEYIRDLEVIVNVILCFIYIRFMHIFIHHK
jgi:hypothetical protein